MRQGGSFSLENDCGNDRAGVLVCAESNFHLNNGHKYVLSGRQCLFVAENNLCVFLNPSLTCLPMATVCLRSHSLSWGILSTPVQSCPYLLSDSWPIPTLTLSSGTQKGFKSKVALEKKWIRIFTPVHLRTWISGTFEGGVKIGLPGNRSDGNNMGKG